MANRINTRSKMMRSPPSTRKAPDDAKSVLRRTAVSPTHNLASSEEDPSSPSNSRTGSVEPQQTVTSNDVMDILLELRGMISHLDEKFSTKVDALSASVDAIRQEIKEEVVTRIDKNETAIAAHGERLVEVEEAIDELRNETEAASKATDLIVKGIPMLPRENVVNIYLQIAATIGYRNEDVPTADIFRLGKKKDGAKFDPPLLMRFTTVHAKNSFHRQYFRHSSLNLQDIGLSANQRIFITENLTKKHQEFYAAAMKLRREKQLYSVSTSRGVVMIRRNPGERPTPVNSLNSLLELSSTSGGR